VLADGRQQRWRISREIGEGLHRERPDDAAAVIQVAKQHTKHPFPVDLAQFEARKHLSDVPANLFFVGRGHLTNKPNLVGT
jgi:hypothetical protein